MSLICRTKEMPGKNGTFKWFVTFLERMWTLASGSMSPLSVLCLASFPNFFLHIFSWSPPVPKKIFAIILVVWNSRLLPPNRKLQPQHGTFPCYSCYRFIIRRQYLTKLSGKKLRSKNLNFDWSPLLGACNSHDKPMQWHFHRPVYLLNIFPAK